MLNKQERFILKTHLENCLDNIVVKKTREIFIVTSGFGDNHCTDEYENIVEAQKRFDYLTSNAEMQESWRTEYYCGGRRNKGLVYTVKLISMREYFDYEDDSWYCTDSTCMDSETYDIDDFITDLIDQD